MLLSCFFFFNDTATTEIYTLSLHDALPIFRRQVALKVIKLGMDTKQVLGRFEAEKQVLALMDHPELNKDRKSTRLNSSHSQISYAVFCLKQKNSPEHLDQQIPNLRHAVTL